MGLRDPAQDGHCGGFGGGVAEATPYQSGDWFPAAQPSEL
jgi:hypothetical protein